MGDQEAPSPGLNGWENTSSLPEQRSGFVLVTGDHQGTSFTRATAARFLQRITIVFFPNHCYTTSIWSHDASGTPPLSTPSQTADLAGSQADEQHVQTERAGAIKEDREPDEMEELIGSRGCRSVLIVGVLAIFLLVPGLGGVLLAPHLLTAFSAPQAGGLPPTSLPNMATATPVPGYQPQPQDDLSSLSMVSATDGWAVGSQGTEIGTTFLLHYDGQSWTQVSAPGPASPRSPPALSC